MRMRRHHYQQEEDTGIDLTPMLDVVFIMLIFFIVTSSFIKESGVEVQRPQADTASAQDRATSSSPSPPMGRSGSTSRRWTCAASAPMSSGCGWISPRARWLSADQDARTGLVVQVMDQARGAGVQDVALAASTGSR